MQNKTIKKGAPAHAAAPSRQFSLFKVFDNAFYVYLIYFGCKGRKNI
jgi:hypothetical protein